eukprot:13783617-Ditylum_brightwellii.AAC.1
MFLYNTYHDALSLMSSKECRQHMMEADIMKRWIMPENSLNRGLNYENQLVGDCPEMSALDANLNKDIHYAVCQHKKGTHAYLHLWDPALQDTNVEHGVPSSMHIIEDM